MCKYNVKPFETDLVVSKELFKIAFLNTNAQLIK